MLRYAIIHFQPIEKYPPALNFIRLLAASQNRQYKVHLITTDPGEGKLNISIDEVYIHRVAKWHFHMSRTSRIVLYKRFLLSSIKLLLKLKPFSVLYYESISAGPAYFYKIWNPSCRLFIHYHEYTSPEEYKTGMILNRWMHRLELSLYKKACWVSHTNEDRMNLFKKDLGSYAPEHTNILPNHPPAVWAKFKINHKPGVKERTGFIYVGALSSETMYVYEMAAYIASRPDECFWDIYSDNHSTEVIKYLEQLKAENISFKGAIAYDALPAILVQYQIGLVLYKGHIPNYIYNVPNKLFEYYVCGLDVWFPQQMKSCMPLVTKGTYPKVIPIDFEKLDEIALDQITSRVGNKYEQKEYACDTTYLSLVRLLANE